MRIFLFIAILLSAQLGNAQVPELNFTWEIKGYDSLHYDQATEFKPTDSTSLGIFEEVPIGFDFEWLGFKFKEVRISASGEVDLLNRCRRNSLGEYIPPITFFKNKNYPVPGEPTKIHYTTKISGNEELFIVEFKNMSSSKFPGNYISYQVILNGKEKTISYKAGEINAPDWKFLSFTSGNDSTSNYNIPGFWILGYRNCDNNFFDINRAVYYDTLSNEYIDSALTARVTTNENLRLFEIPEKGTTFIFNGDLINSVSTFEKSDEGFTLAPNPATDRFRIISSKPYTVEKIYSITGIEVSNIKQQGEWYFLDGVPSGIYFITFKESYKSQKLIIK